MKKITEIEYIPLPKESSGGSLFELAIVAIVLAVIGFVGLSALYFTIFHG